METYNENFLNYYSSILDYLYQSGNLSLPSIGCWSVKNSSAYLRDNRTIYPSQVTLEFHRYQESDFESQLKYFSDNWGMTKLEVHQVLLLFSANILKTCSVNQSYHLPQLGEILWENDEISFISSQELEKSYNYYNKPLHLSSSFLKRDATQAEIPEKEMNSEKFITLRPKYYKAIAASLLFVILSFVSLTLIFQEESRFVPVKFNIENTEYSAEDFNRAPETDGSIENIDKILEDISVESLPINNDTSSNKSILIEEASGENESTLDANPKPNSCTYILGSFGRQYNADRLQDQLSNMSISTYKEKIGNLIRVGATIDCNDTKAYNQLSKVESNLWLLEE